MFLFHLQCCRYTILVACLLVVINVNNVNALGSRCRQEYWLRCTSLSLYNVGFNNTKSHVIDSYMKKVITCNLLLIFPLYQDQMCYLALASWTCTYSYHAFLQQLWLYLDLLLAYSNWSNSWSKLSNITCLYWFTIVLF